MVSLSEPNSLLEPFIKLLPLLPRVSESISDDSILQRLLSSTTEYLESLSEEKAVEFTNLALPFLSLETTKINEISCKMASLLYPYASEFFQEKILHYSFHFPLQSPSRLLFMTSLLTQDNPNNDFPACISNYVAAIGKSSFSNIYTERLSTDLLFSYLSCQSEESLESLLVTPKIYVSCLRKNLQLARLLIPTIETSETRILKALALNGSIEDALVEISNSRSEIKRSSFLDIVTFALKIPSLSLFSLLKSLKDEEIEVAVVIQWFFGASESNIREVLFYLNNYVTSFLSSNSSSSSSSSTLRSLTSTSSDLTKLSQLLELLENTSSWLSEPHRQSRSILYGSLKALCTEASSFSSFSFQARVLSLLSSFEDFSIKDLFELEVLVKKSRSWELRDSYLVCSRVLFSKNHEYCSENYNYEPLIDFVLSCTTDFNSFVRSSSLCTLGSIYPFASKFKIPPESLKIHLEKILRHETEAIVRRQTPTLFSLLESKDQLELLSLSFLDLDWEVREKALDVYSLLISRTLKFSSLNLFLNSNNERILSSENGALLSSENEKISSSENGALLSSENENLLLSSENERITSSENGALLSSENEELLWSSENEKLLWSPLRILLQDYDERIRHRVYALCLSLQEKLGKNTPSFFPSDLPDKMKEFDEYVERQVGLSGILEDIFQFLENSENTEVIIDCV